MKLVIDIPDNIFPALVNMAHSANKPAEQFVEDHVNQSLRQRLYHLRATDNQSSDAACGFHPEPSRGDRPALSRDLFLQAEPPQRRCPDCAATIQQVPAASPALTSR